MKYKPMMAKNGEESLLTNSSYLFEPKLDGVRTICYKDGKKLKLISRNGVDVTKKYPEFNFSDSIKAKQCVLDGEIVVYSEDGNPEFSLWQERNKHKGIVPHHLLATYVVFDILEKNGKDITDIPLEKRKEILEKTVAGIDVIQTSVSTTNGKKLWSLIKKRKLEGVIAKTKSGLYESGRRSDEWFKIKLFKTMDVVIVGYTKEKRAVTSLAMGLYYDGMLHFAGKVGTGFSESTIQELKETVEKIKIKKSPIDDLPDDVFPVKPKLVAEVKYYEVTNEKKLRAPVFLRLRDDKPAEECTL